MKNDEKNTTLLVSVIIAVLLSFPIWGAFVFPAWGKPHYIGEVEGHDAQYWYEQYLNARHEMFLWENIAHQYYEFKDYDFIDEEGNMIGRHNFWDDCISESEAWFVLDSIKQGDWEDFPFDWDNNYSVDF